jgi:hypothetical protein
MGGRVVEGTGLENRQTCKRLEGSNPSPSANTLCFFLRKSCHSDFGPHIYPQNIDWCRCSPMGFGLDRKAMEGGARLSQRGLAGETSAKADKGRIAMRKAHLKGNY